MTTITPRPHDTDFHEHATQNAHPVGDQVATEQSINGDTSQHDTDNGYAQLPLSTSETNNNNDLSASKPQRSSPPPLVDTTVTEETSIAPTDSIKEVLPPVTQIMEIASAADDPTMPTTVTTVASEVPPPEAVAEQLSGSPEVRTQMDAPLSIPGNVAQAVISDERNEPFEHENLAASDALDPIKTHRAENGNVVVPVTEFSQTSLPADATASSDIPVPALVTEPQPPTSILDAPTPVISEAEKVEETINLGTEDTSKMPSADAIMEDTKMEDVISTSGKIAREREEDDEEMGPEAKRTKTEVVTESKPDPELGMITERQHTEVEVTAPETQSKMEPTENDVTMITQTEVTAQNGDSVAVTTTTAGAPPEAAKSAEPERAPLSDDWGPLTDFQGKQLKAVMVKLKKAKSAVSFSKPVDTVGLNIPTYPEIIKNPMDLSTMDQKIRDGKYTSVNDFITDFNLIVDNCITFNGPQHVISLAAKNLLSHFNSVMKSVPKAGEIPPTQPKKERKSSIALPPRESKPRESRPSMGSATSPTGAANQTFALGKDGVPLTRRTSTNHGDRPKREIHKPPPKELPYSVKPKKKKFQMELRFAEYVLGELKRGRYSQLMAPFANPVDPVALNIPEYHKFVKKPMDFSTITTKLNTGMYENLKEFEADVRLVFSNCVKFNGPEHAISMQGRQLESHFDDLVKKKQSWINENTIASAPQSPVAYTDTSDEEEEDDDDEEETAAHQARQDQIANLQAKIAELSAQVTGLGAVAPVKKAEKPKKKTEKTKKGSGAKQTKKSAPTPAASSKKQDKRAAPKAKQKPAQKITMKEKAEIAERIGELSTEDTTKAADYIKKGLKDIGSPLADRPDEELEFDIDVIPENTLHQLLKLVRKNDAPVKETRPAYVPAKSNTVSRPKKNKPMGKHEQEDAIRRLKNQMENFHNSDAAGGSDPTTGQEAVSSGDEDSGSESEEE